MKKKLISLSTVITFALLFFTGCQKEIQQKEETPLAGENSLQSRTNTDDDPGCQLKYLDYDRGLALSFKYNNDGLAREVMLDYGDGLPEVHKITYDRKDRLVRTKVYDNYNGIVIDFIFFYNRNLITRATGYYEGTHNLWRDIFYTYNNKDQMIKLDDVVQDIHVKYFHNRQGYHDHGEYYVGNDLLITWDYKFNIRNRNPFLAVPGVYFGFWDFTLPTFDKEWESNDYVVFYEEGTPTVVLNTDPAKTRMHTGPHNYLTSATKYDRISESFYTETMNYKNCGGGHENENDNDAATSTGKQFKPLTPRAKLQRILSGPSKNIKQQLTELKRQLKK